MKDAVERVERAFARVTLYDPFLVHIGVNLVSKIFVEATKCLRVREVAQNQSETDAWAKKDSDPFISLREVGNCLEQAHSTPQFSCADISILRFVCRSVLPSSMGCCDVKNCEARGWT